MDAQTYFCIKPALLTRLKFSTVPFPCDTFPSVTDFGLPQAISSQCLLCLTHKNVQVQFRIVMMVLRKWQWNKLLGFICDGLYVVQNVVFMEISSFSLTRVTQEVGNFFFSK